MKIHRRRRGDFQKFGKLFVASLPSYQLAEKAQSRPDISCKAGCGACCNELPKLTLAEAVILLESLKPDQRARILEAVSRELTHIKEVADEAGDPMGSRFRTRWWAKRRPCVFLTKEQTCSVYDRRPLQCAMYMVRSPPKNCEKIGEGRLEIFAESDFISRFSQLQANAAVNIGINPLYTITYALLPWALHWAMKWLQDTPKQWIRTLSGHDYRRWGFALLTGPKKEDWKVLVIP